MDLMMAVWGEKLLCKFKMKNTFELSNMTYEWTNAFCAVNKSRKALYNSLFTVLTSGNDLVVVLVAICCL